MSFDYISQYNERNLDINMIDVPSIRTEELEVVHNIAVGGTVDGVNISELESRVDDHEDRISALEDVPPGDFVDRSTNQTVGGVKTFKNPVIYNPTDTVGVIKQEFSGNNAKLSIMSSGDNEAILQFGSNEFSPEIQEGNRKWLVTAKKGMEDGRLLFSTSKFFGGEEHNMMALRNSWIRWEGVTTWSQLIEMYKDLKMVGGNIILDEGKTVDGVDVSDLDSRAVLVDTDQTISGKKTFTQEVKADAGLTVTGDLGVTGNSNVKNIIASGYIDAIAMTSTGKVEGNTVLVNNYLQVKHGANGQVLTGIGLRSANRAEQFMISNGDNVSEIMFGSDTDGTGRDNKNIKWDFSSRSMGEGRFIFYRGPAYTGSFDEKEVYTPGTTYNEIITFQNSKNNTTKKYDCDIIMHRPVVFNVPPKINGNDLTVSSWKPNLDRFYWLGQYEAMFDNPTTCSIQKIANTVTMTVGTSAGKYIKTGVAGADHLKTDITRSPIPVEFRPDVDLMFPLVIRRGLDQEHIVTKGEVKTDGSVWIYADEVAFIHFQGYVKFSSFTVTWVKGL